jgi:hypothetical protein
MPRYRRATLITEFCGAGAVAFLVGSEVLNNWYEPELPPDISE